MKSSSSNDAQKKVNKLIKIVWITALSIWAGVMLIWLIFPSGSSTCDCIDRMTDAALYGGSDETKYLKCLDNYYDEAFDYIEANDPNGKYENYEAVIQHYWRVKCDESR